MVLSALLMATTSTEIGGLFAHGQGHKIAQGYGMFLWAGVVLYVATAWRVWVECGRDRTAELGSASSPVRTTRRRPPTGLARSPGPCTSRADPGLDDLVRRLTQEPSTLPRLSCGPDPTVSSRPARTARRHGLDRRQSDADRRVEPVRTLRLIATRLDPS